MPYISNMVGNYLLCLQVVFVETLQCMSAECFCCQRCVTRIRNETPLQPLSGKQFHYRTANVGDGAHLDVSAESFWG